MGKASFFNLIDKNPNFFLIAGPCVIESYENAYMIADSLKTICKNLDIPFVFKASYRKANRSSISSFSGIGDEKAIKILAEIKSKLDVSICTDIHNPVEADMLKDVADIIQIPAFLCRQTDLLVAAAETGKIVNIKKGQFLSPDAMKFAADKVKHSGNNNILLTERGTSFGYQDLVVDFRSIPIMKSLGFPVVMDVTHSLQQPNQNSGVTGGKPELIETYAKAAISVGVDGLFIETHPEPQKALSDGANMLKLSNVEDLMKKLIKLRKAL